MARVNLGNYDPGTGWPPDDSTGVNWQDDVDLPGSFGPGGFSASPRLTAPASGPPPGISLSAKGTGPTTPDQVIPPENSTIPSGKTLAPRTGNPFTDVHINPATGQPEMLTGPDGLAEKTRGALNPFGFIGRGNPYWRGAIAGAGILQPTPTASDDTISPEMAGARPEYPHTPTPMSQTAPFNQPAHPSTMLYPSWPTPPAPAPNMQRGMPWPDTGVANPGAPIGSPAPAVPVPRPRAAGPAAAKQQPNLGAYNPFTTLDYRPNSGPNERNRGSPVATALDLSRLFGGGQPAAPAAAPVPLIARQPSIRMIPPAIPIGGGAGNVMEAPSPRRKGSSSSQGGGY